MPKLGLGLSLPQTRVSSSASPIPTSDLSLWLKADAGVTLSGANVTAWADQSGNGKNATSIVNPTYTASAKNGKPAITFSGAELMTTANIFNGANARTMFAAYYVDNDETANTICGQTNDVEVVSGSFFLLQARSDLDSNPYLATANDDLPGSPFVNQVWKISMADYDGTTGNLYSNGTNVGTNTFSWNTHNGTFCIGSYFTNDDSEALQELLVGKVAEIVVYNRVLTTGERQQVEAYLANKYAIQIPNINNMFLPQLWLKADAGVTLSGSNVTAWADQSGNGNNATARTGNSTFVSSVINGKPVLRFNGTANLITNNFFVHNYNTPITIIAVSKASASTVFGGNPTARYIYGVANNGGYNTGLTYGAYGTETPNFSVGFSIAYLSGQDIESSPMGENQVAISTSINSGSLISAFLNGTIVGTADPTDQSGGTDSTGEFSIGSEVTLDEVDNFFCTCDIAEIIIYNRAITTPERQQVEAYLNTKYAIY